MYSNSRIRPVSLSGVLAALIVGLGSPSLPAQSAFGPRPMTAPSYGAPTSPVMADFNTRVMTPFSIGVSVAVPVSELQALLPPGFSPVPLETDATKASVSVLLNEQTQSEFAGPLGTVAAGTYGPYNGMTISTLARNTAGQNQLFNLVGYANNQVIVDANNVGAGPGTSRFADISFVVRDIDGLMRLHAVARDPDTGLVVNVVIDAPPEITGQTRNLGPFLGQFVALGNPAVVAGASWTTVSSDSAAVDLQASGVDVKRMRLRFASGNLTADAVPISASVSWNVEVFFKKLF